MSGRRSPAATASTTPIPNGTGGAADTRRKATPRKHRPVAVAGGCGARSSPARRDSAPVALGLAAAASPEDGESPPVAGSRSRPSQAFRRGVASPDDSPGHHEHPAARRKSSRRRRLADARLRRPPRASGGARPDGWGGRTLSTGSRRGSIRSPATLGPVRRADISRTPRTRAFAGARVRRGSGERVERCPVGSPGRGLRPGWLESASRLFPGRRNGANRRRQEGYSWLGESLRPDDRRARSLAERDRAVGGVSRVGEGRFRRSADPRRTGVQAADRRLVP